ncbi:hypothetical protein [Streptomyces sp. AA0539]|nr:hypothetical protein [Streptomyces sp. AA0539]
MLEFRAGDWEQSRIWCVLAIKNGIPEVADRGEGFLRLLNQEILAGRS